MRYRLLLSMSAVALGVAALVAIDSFATNVRGSVHDNARALLGGDLSLTAGAPLSGRAATLLDSLVRTGAETAQVTTFPSMAVAPRSGRTRLVQIHGVSSRYPLVGAVTTEPARAWSALGAGPHAIVDRTLLAALDAQLGDTLTLGYAQFVITGVIRTVPGAAEIIATLGPRVYIAAPALAGTQLLGFGSRAQYQTLLALAGRPEPPSPSPRWLARTRDTLDAEHVRLQTAADAETNTLDTIATLTDFLELAGLAALLLGGIGVASGVSAFVARKLDAAAILRCLGATGRQVLTIYLLQAVAMGLAGAALGAAAGVAIQFLLPQAVHDVLPIDVTVAVVPRAIAAGLALGVWVAVLSALGPLTALRRVPPLAALRRNVDPSVAVARRSDPLRHAVSAAILVTVLGVTMLRSSRWQEGAATGAGLIVVFTVLWLAAAGAARVARRLARVDGPYPVRQGLANLDRPANQTRAVVLALGFGAFVIATLYFVQANLLRRFAAVAQASQGNMLFFDVQDDQHAGVDSIVRAQGQEIVEETPIVTMRIVAINGRAADRREGLDSSRGEPGRRRARRAGGTRDAPHPSWAVRHEFRSTYRDTLVATERIVAGRWFARRASGAPPDSVREVSLETGIAQDLGVTVGDHITWDVQGVPLVTRITSLRSVNWARFEPNFFAVFPAGVLAGAPAQYVVLARVSGATEIAAVDRAVVERYPNVSSIDLSLIRETVNRAIGRARLAIRFLALFAIAIGLPVLFGAVAATHRERLREGVLLKTLGASRAQVGRIMLVEYAALGLSGSVAGLALATAAAWALVHFVFDAPFAFTLPSAAGVAALTTAVAVGVGVFGTRATYAAPAMATLREID